MGSSSQSLSEIISDNDWTWKSKLTQLPKPLGSQQWGVNSDFRDPPRWVGYSIPTKSEIFPHLGFAPLCFCGACRKFWKNLKKSRKIRNIQSLWVLNNGVSTEIFVTLQGEWGTQFQQNQKINWVMWQQIWLRIWLGTTKHISLTWASAWCGNKSDSVYDVAQPNTSAWHEQMPDVATHLTQDLMWHNQTHQPDMSKCVMWQHIWLRIRFKTVREKKEEESRRNT